MEDVNTSLLHWVDHPDQKKINKETVGWSNTADQVALTGMHTTLHHSSTGGRLKHTGSVLQDSRRLAHQTSFSKPQRVKIISTLF
jgi:hypothetical protein